MMTMSLSGDDQKTCVAFFTHMCYPDSYRAIASSSLILKLFERCILLIWGDQLHSDSLQFGFKQRCSTGTATWLVQEVLRQYLSRGSKPVAVVLDCSKAFDLAKFDLLFSRLLERGLPPVVVRVLVFSYEEQVGWVRWGRSCNSSTFSIKNGTKQGSVASPAFWSVYLDPLFSKLREAGVGCRLAGREVPEGDYWRAGLLKRLLAEQLLAGYAADVEQEKRLEGLISSLVQN